MPLPIASEEPLPLTVTVAPAAVKAVGAGSVSVAPPLTLMVALSALVRPGRLCVPPLTLSVPPRVVIWFVSMVPAPESVKLTLLILVTPGSASERRR